MKSARVRQDETRVELVIDGVLVAVLPHQSARELAQAIIQQANRARDWEEAARVARDQAILIRAGTPIGITDQIAIRREAESLAQHDRDLRRYMPSIPSEARFGAPVVRAHPKASSSEREG